MCKSHPIPLPAKNRQFPYRHGAFEMVLGTTFFIRCVVCARVCPLVFKAVFLYLKQVYICKLAGSKKSRIPSEKLKSCSASCLDGAGLPNFIQYQFVSWTAMPTDGHQPHLWRWAPPTCEQGSGDMMPC